MSNEPLWDSVKSKFNFIDSNQAFIMFLGKMQLDEICEENHVQVMKLIKNKKYLQFYVENIEIPYIRNPFQDRHIHEYFQFYYLRSGVANHYLNGNVVQMVRGDYTIIPPGIPHIMYCLENQSAEAVFMDFAFDAVFNGKDDEEIENSIDYHCLKDFLYPPETLQPKMSVSEHNRRQIEMLLDHITQMQVNEIDDIQSDYLARMNLLTLLASLVVDSHSQEHDRHLKPGQDDQDLLKPGLDLIRSNFAGDIACANAAKACNLSPSYFRHLLKECTGKTFTNLLTELRVNYAIDLLTNTGKSIMEISLDCGFSDISSLYRAFKKSVGLSPLIYRSKKREIKQNLQYSKQDIH